MAIATRHSRQLHVDLTEDDRASLDYLLEIERRRTHEVSASRLQTRLIRRLIHEEKARATLATLETVFA